VVDLILPACFIPLLHAWVVVIGQKTLGGHHAFQEWGRGFWGLSSGGRRVGFGGIIFLVFFS
jgi:hypothetical protein